MLGAEHVCRPPQLYVYDLTHGMAKQLSPALMGKQIDGVWHTGVVFWDPSGKKATEYFFSAGVQRLPAGTTPFGIPHEVIDLGRTEIPQVLIRGAA